MIRRALTLALLLGMETGCPHAWVKGGTLDMALRKDLDAERRSRRLVFPCDMPLEQWRKACAKDNASASNCPPECRIKE